MDFGGAVRVCLQEKYAKFDGRASRSEYWWFRLAVLIAVVVIEIVGGVLGHVSSILGGLIVAVGILALIVPDVCVTVRRLHDTNRSGWFFWVALIPFVGGIILLIWFCSQGTSGPNKYGDDPLAEGLAETFR